MTTTQELWIIGHKIEPINTSGAYDAFIGETPGGVPGPPPHYHTTYAELFMVLKGRMEFMKDGEKIILHEGESVDVPPGCIHTFSNPTTEPIRWLNIHSPKGFSAFFETFGVPIDEDDAFRSSVSEATIMEVMQKAESFDMNIV